MTASALSIPEPLPDDPDAVTTALETAAIFGTQGDAREAVRWVRRAAELAGDEGNDVRALTLARVAADLTTQIGSDSGPAPANAPPPVEAPQSVATGAAANPAISAALDAALGLTASSEAAPAAIGGNDAPGAPDWAPPVPPPPIGEAVAPPSNVPLGSAQPPAQSLREALQRFSQHATQPNVASPVAPSSSGLQPDPQQQPALAALVQSIVQQTPRTQAISAALSSADERAMLADTLPGAQQVAEPEIERTQPDIASSKAALSSDPFSDAVTDPRTVPAVGLRGDAPFTPARASAEPLPSASDPDVEPASLPLAAKPVSSKGAPAGSRQAVRVSIAATTEKGVYLVELLKDGSAPAPGSHEAFVVLTDPNADPFDD